MLSKYHCFVKNLVLDRRANGTVALQKRLYSSGDNDAYIERIARDRLGYVSPDERIYIDMSGE